MRGEVVSGLGAKNFNAPEVAKSLGKGLFGAFVRS